MSKILRGGRHAGKHIALAIVPLLCVMGAAQSGSAEEPASQAADSASAASGSFFSPPAKLRYDTEYPAIGYARTPVNNSIARLQTRLDRGETRLEFNAAHGYLDSILKVLGIDPSSQTLVYSRTSLLVGSIRAATPRAIYFNDDTYVAWVQDADLLELGAMDSDLGQVFYTLPNRKAGATQFTRETLRCLSCHDSYSLSGGGVPRFLLMSSYVGINGEFLTHEGSILTSDKTPLRYRWGGWYVTGQHGDQVHLGNVLVRRAQELTHLEEVRRGNLDSLDALFDTRPYLTNKSDIVALLVLQHQTYIQNLITRVNFEVRTALAKEDQGGSAGKMPPKTQAALQEFMEQLVQGMLFVDAAEFTSRITGNSGFDAWFQARGPRDAHGRSLRELDLTTRLFKYPLSFLVYSEGFDTLPDYAKSYIYGRFSDILSGRDQSKEYSHLSAGDRKALLEILTATKPAFAQATAHTKSALLIRGPGAT